MKGPWLRNSQANVLTAAMMTTALLVWPIPANTSVYSPNPILESVERVQSLPGAVEAPTETAPAPSETTLDQPQSGKLPAQPEIQLASAPGFLAIAPRIPTPRTVPEPSRPRREPLLPNLFGTVAVATSQTPANWVDHVSMNTHTFEACMETNSACGGDAASWRRTVENLADDPLRQRLERANVFVNNQIRFRSDASATGQRDSWISPDQLFRTGRGDCEDYALAKYWLLSAAGVPEEDMFVMVVSDLIARADHAYLAVRVGESFVLLDSRTDMILLPEAVDDIVPLITIGASGAYLHGRPA
jgi:predicted transglutaminase-like cysteine proteinase